MSVTKYIYKQILKCEYVCPYQAIILATAGGPILISPLTLRWGPIPQPHYLTKLGKSNLIIALAGGSNYTGPYPNTFPYPAGQILL